MSKILVIDDNKDSLISIREVLKILDSSYQVTTTQGSEEGLEKAKKESPDTILLDISMPYMDGFEVCKLLKTDDATKHVPVVMLTAIQTDLRSRIKAFELGADAFLTKPIDEAELGAQINVMLRIKKAEDKLRLEKKSLEDLVQEKTKSLQESQINLQTLFNSIDDFLFVIDTEGNILNVNPVVLRRLGYSGEELLGKSVLEVHPPDLRDKAADIVVDIIAGKSDSCPIPLMAKDGTQIPVDTKVTRGRWGDKDVFFGVSRDITELEQAKFRRDAALKELRKSEEKYRLIAENTSDVISLHSFDLKATYTYASPSIKAISGYEPEELLGKSCFELIHPEDKNVLFPLLKKYVSLRMKNFLTGKESTVSETIEYRIKDKSGNWRYAQSTGNIVGNQLLFISRDITERKKAEENNLRLAEVIRNACDGIVLTNTEGQIHYVNPAFEKMNGYTESELLNKDPANLIVTDDTTVIAKEIRSTVKSKGEWKGELSCRRKNGEIYPIDTRVFAIKDTSGKLVEIAAIQQDIAERKKAEETLNKDFQQQKLLSEVSYLFTKLEDFKKNMNNAIRLIGEHTDVSRVYISEDFNNGEYTKNTYEWCNINIEPQIDNLQEVHYTIIPSFKKNLKEKGLVLSSNIFELPKDIINILEPQAIKSILILPIYVQNQFLGFMGFDECVKNRIWEKSEIELLKTIVNILSNSFERKKVESREDAVLKSLRESEQKYHSVLEQSVDNIYLFDVETKRVLEANAALQNLLGYSTEEMKGLTVYDFVNHTSEDIDQKIEMILKNGSVFLKERKYRCKDGTILDVEISANSIIHKGKKTLCVVSRDITKRKIAEEALQESEEKYRQLAETAKDTIMMLDLKGNVKYINKEGLKLSGYSEDEVLQMNVNDVLPVDQLQSSYEKFEKRAAGESQIFMYEIEFINKKGKRIPVEVKSSLIEEQGKPSGVLIIARDITERKKAEKSLQDSELRYRTMINSMSDAIHLVDSDLRYTMVNPTMQRWAKGFGLGTTDIIGKTIFEVFPSLSEKICDKVRKEYKQVFCTGKTLITEETITFKNTDFITETRKIPVFEKGKVTQVVTVIRDITERKLMEEELRNERNFAESLVHTAQAVVLVLDTEGRIVRFNPYLEEISGYHLEEVQGKDWFTTFLPEREQDSVRELFMKAVGDIRTQGNVNLIVAKDGSKHVIEWYDSILKDTNGNIMGLLAIGHDITERKRADEELRKYSENQKVLIREINHRVRNNLTAIISMIYTEEDLAKRKGMFDLLSVLRNLAIRILGLSTIHSLLSESEWRPLKIKQLCENVINATLKSMDSFKKINITIVPSEVRVESDQAHHLALVINELTTNSMKHAFENKEKGNISVNIEEEGENILLHFRDDGPGYSEEMLKGDFSKTSTGFEIIQGIVKRNLAGQLKLNNDNGAVTTIIFLKSFIIKI